MSPDGRCKALDVSADGYVRSEARAVLALGAMRSTGGRWAGGGSEVFFPVSDVGAEARHTPPPAFIIVNGTAVNQDGRSSSLTAPNGPAQQAAMRLAVKECGDHGCEDQMIGDIVTISMHGTGTSLGDPIEVGAIAAVHRKNKANNKKTKNRAEAVSSSESDTWQPLVLEAVKSYIGHTELTAGVMGLMQPLTSLTQCRSTKILHLSALNPHVGAAAGTSTHAIFTPHLSLNSYILSAKTG